MNRKNEKRIYPK